MKKYLFLLVTILLSIPNVALAVTDLSQEDFDLAKEIGEYNGLAYSEEYHNYWFKTDGEYRLIEDVTLTNQIVSNNADPELIIDLNGNTLSYDTNLDDMSIFITVYSSKFTIKGNGKIKSNAKMKYILVGAEGSDITLDGCTIEGRVLLDGEKELEKLTVKSGKYGSLSAVKGKVIIDDGDFNSDFLEREVITVNNDVDLTINGGTFKSKYGALKSITSPNDYNTTKITINGGTFIGKERYGLTLGGHEKIKINGGVFKDDKNTITITKDNKKDLDKLISIGTVTGTIKITKGDKSKYIKGENNNLSVTVDEKIENFIYGNTIYGEVYVDNKRVTNNNFSYSKNTTVTLKKSYLDKLKNGDHTLVVVSGYGDYATITFTVLEKTNIVLYVSIIGIVSIVIILMALYVKKKNKK